MKQIADIKVLKELNWVTAAFFMLFAMWGLPDFIHAEDDPWKRLQKRFTSVQKPVQQKLEKPADPWKRLQAIYLPFSENEAAQAARSRTVKKGFARKVHMRLSAFDSAIKEASRIFNIPECVIRAVILAESGGDPGASAKITSAKGLMQTIDSTFAMARSGLRQDGIYIKDNPHDPRSSIMAGTWYLDRMYKKAHADKKMARLDRSDIASWRYPLEYYYAGPSNGIKKENKIMVFSNGTRRVIDKRAYSKKIQKWAQILAG